MDDGIRDRGQAVCVIGAGPAGMAAALALKAEGLDFDIYDPRDRVGGIWAYDPEPGRTCAWETMNLNSPRGWYEFRDHPMPADHPDFPRREQVAAYLEGVADRSGLRPHLRLSEAVREVVPEDVSAAFSGGASRGPRWIVRTDAGRAAVYRAVVVANGHHNQPFIPERPGHFAGMAIHSRDYRYREPFRGKRVLVVGIGNSGSQISVDVSLAAAQTLLSVRRGVWVLPHYVRGLRIDRAMPAWLNHLVAAWVPERLAGPALSLFYRLLLGRPDKLGLPRPDHHFGAALPTVSENLMNRLGDGRLRVVPDIAAFEGDGVRFVDGTRACVDAIIWCTGYRNSFPFLAPEIFAPQENRAPLFIRAFHPDRPGLVFMGLMQAVGWSFLPVFEAQARLIAAELAGRYMLPPVARMRAEIAADAAQVARRYVATPRNQYQVNAEVFRHACDRELRAGLRRAGRGVARVPPVSAAAAPGR